MTTIVYDHEKRMIAVDGRAIRGDIIESDNLKKWRKIGYTFWFFSGSLCDIDRFIGGMNREFDSKPDYKINCFAIVAKESECWAYGITDEGEPWRYKLENSYATGSGQHFAIAALDHGKSALDAVRYAATRDPNTGGLISVFDVEKMEFVGDN